MSDCIQIALDKITEALGAAAPDHRAHVDTFSAARLRALREAPPLDWPGLVVHVPSPLLSR
jgi:hypothetical protein